MFSLYLCLSICVAVLVKSLAAGYFRRDDIPGPWHTRITKSMLIFQSFRRNRKLWIHSMHLRYGPVVRIGPNEVSFTSPKAVKEIYQSGGSGYDKSHFYDMFQEYGELTAFSTLNKAEHTRRRKTISGNYAMSRILRPDLMSGLQERAKIFTELCSKSNEDSVDIYNILHRYSLDCVTFFLFGDAGTRSLNSDPEGLKILHQLSYNDSLISRLVEIYFSPPSWLTAMIVVPEVESFVDEYVIRQADDDRNEKISLVDHLRNPIFQMSPIQIAAECEDHMSAGTDTTGDALCFIMHELSLPRSKLFQSHLREEIQNNVDAQLNELEYLDAVVKEGLRLFAPIPMSLPRVVPDGGRIIDNYHVPAGVIVSCQAHSVHRLNDPVWDNSDEFLPSRWLTQETSALNDLFFAFSAGSRGCVGKSLAIVEMKLLLRMIYGHFETRIDIEKAFDMSIDDQIINSRPRDQSCFLQFRQI